MEAKQQRALISEIKGDPELAEAFTMPTVAWPTIAILLISFAGFGMSTYAYLTGALSPFITIPLSGFFVFWSFTPLHEAVHRNLSTISWLQDYIGTFSAQLLLPGFSTSLYRYLHVTHHSRTGQANDPDLKFTEDNILMCWLYSAFLDVIWTRFYFSVWSERPKGERARFSLGLVLYLTMFVVAFSSPYLVEFIIAFLLPMFFGRVLVVYLLATIQHRKGHEQRVDPIGATSVQDVDSKWWQHLFMLGQSQHLIHHMYPGVPWYKYDPIWRVLKAKTKPEMLRPSSYFARNQNH
jgi:vanillate O-demethylase ferredoxin subunit